jgi:hypothetical protein
VELGSVVVGGEEAKDRIGDKVEEKNFLCLLDGRGSSSCCSGGARSRMIMAGSQLKP